MLLPGVSPGRRGGDMDTAAATVAASTIAVSALGFGLIQYNERRRQQLLTDIYGGKEAAAAIATRVRNGRLPRWRRNRGELLEAMCLAAVFGESGQSRSLLYAALAKAMVTEEYRHQIMSNIEDIHTIIARNSPYADLAGARHRLFALSAALNIDGDLRIRVERADIYSNQVDDMMTPDERCTDEAHRWDALREVLKQRESVVAVCPGHGRDGNITGCATLALDFHKVARITARIPAAVPAATIARTRLDRLPLPASERFLLTESAKRLHRAKYQRNVADVRSIASELASIIVSHAMYSKAEIIAVVSGRKHDCSIQIGTEVANLAAKMCVTLNKQDECDAESKFMLAEPGLVKDREVIIVDDVYRTGDTMRDAAQVLRRAGARQVLGLTVTCTVSAIIPQ
jgi:hypoxanthine-guanine phosphoribosyltransferase